MPLTNGEYFKDINTIRHWIKIEGAEHKTRPLIVLHGGPGGNHYTFERTTGPHLSKERTVVYYEQRGCGRSEKPSFDTDYKWEQLISDFNEIILWLGIEKVDLLGYSFGGELALELAYSLPEVINRLLLSAPSLIDLEIGKIVQIAGFMSIADSHLLSKINNMIQQGLSVSELYNQIWNQVDTKTVDRLLFQNQKVARINRSFWEESQLINTGLVSETLQNHPREVPLIKRLRDIQHETLILTGIHDRNTGIPLSNLIHKELPNSRLQIFPNSAHFPDLEETEGFVEAVLEFLKL